MILLLLRLSYLLLLIIGITGLFSLAPPGVHIVSSILMALILYGPLLLMSPAVISGNKRQATWLCFILLFYFCGFAVQLLDPPPIRTLAIAKTTLTVVVFVLAALQIRQKQHAD
ncbi:MAG: DUF2069 domain-containing protein [Pseudomonadales bacterium]|nr:DUF2069 domain-containing protein [Pseudomonadales bacterium]